MQMQQSWDPTTLAEGQSWLEPLYEIKNIAFGVARWIPPAFPGLTDD
jgi:hypothetical protein